MPEIIGHNLHLEPNPRAIPSEPGEYHDWVAEKDAEIERLKLALRIAVEEIQGLEHPETCTFEGTKSVCVVCGLTEWCHRRGWKCPNAPEYRWTPRQPKRCNCRISRALARIERAKDGRTESTAIG